MNEPKATVGQTYIQALKAELAASNEAAMGYIAERDALAAQLAETRAALEQVVAACPPNGLCGGDWTCDRCRIARAALAKVPA